MASRAGQLLEIGQSVWLDFIRRGHMQSGEFDALVRNAGVVGVTSNPTIFQKAIGDSDDYDTAIEKRIAQGLKGSALLDSLVVEDIQSACDRLADVHRRTGGRDGRVSIEVDPHFSDDTGRTISEGRRLHAAVARANVMVKVPATRAGLPAITALTADGVSVNITLIFSRKRYREVMDAYLTGLEQRAAKGGDLASVHSVASFFVSRVDTKVDDVIESRMKETGAAEAKELKGLLGQAAVANARLAYQAFLETFSSARFAALEKKGAHRQRPLWASTSTKNPAYRDVLYVEELIGADTVNTMPLATLDAFNDHGVVEARIHRDLDGAARLFEGLPALGVPVDALIAELEEEGVVAFEQSIDKLLETLEAKRTTLIR